MSESSPNAIRRRVSVVILNYNGAGWLPGCLDALAAQTFRDHEVLLVDNGSRDASVPLLRQRYGHVRVIALDRNTGFAAAVNAGIRAAEGEYVALLNTDTVARPGWLAALVRALDQSPADTGAIASRMLSLDDPSRIDDAGDALSWTGAAEKLGHGELASRFTHRGEVFSVCADFLRSASWALPCRPPAALAGPRRSRPMTKDIEAEITRTIVPFPARTSTELAQSGRAGR